MPNSGEIETNQEYTKYTVKPWDNLTTIAKNNDTTVSKIANLNNISNINFISLGQVLKIPNKNKLIALPKCDQKIVEKIKDSEKNDVRKKATNDLATKLLWSDWEFQISDFHNINMEDLNADKILKAFLSLLPWWGDLDSDENDDVFSGNWIKKVEDDDFLNWNNLKEWVEKNRKMLPFWEALCIAWNNPNFVKHLKKWWSSSCWRWVWETLIALWVKDFPRWWRDWWKYDKFCANRPDQFTKVMCRSPWDASTWDIVPYWKHCTHENATPEREEFWHVEMKDGNWQFCSYYKSNMPWWSAKAERNLAIKDNEEYRKQTGYLWYVYRPKIKANIWVLSAKFS